MLSTLTTTSLDTALTSDVTSELIVADTPLSYEDKSQEVAQRAVFVDDTSTLNVDDTADISRIINEDIPDISFDNELIIEHTSVDMADETAEISEESYDEVALISDTK